MFRKEIHFVIVFIIGLDIVVSQSLLENTYNCKRPGYACADGRCLNGACECPAGKEGYNCGLMTDQKGCETDNCKNGGTCYTQDDSEKCFCPPTHVGDTCEQAVDSWECLGTEMKVELLLPESFSGLAYSLNSRSDCPFETTDSNVPGYKMALATIPFDNTTCGAEPVLDSPSPGDITYMASMVVGFHQSIQTRQDRIITLNCTHPSSNVSMEADMDSNVNEKGNLTKNEDKKMYSPVKFTFLDFSDKPLDRSLYVGEEFTNLVYLTSTDVYSHILLDNCKATDGDPESPKELILLKDACPTMDGELVMQDPPGQVQQVFTPEGGPGPLPAVALKMLGFRFYSKSKQVIISCVVKICKEEDKAVCEVPKCGAGGPEGERVTNGDTATGEGSLPPAVRRKRSAGATNTTEQTVSSIFTIKDEKIVLEQTAEQEEKDCFRSKEIVIVIIVMSSLVLLMLVTCAVLACLIFRSRNKVKKMLYENRGPGFHIPRPEVCNS